MVDLSQVPTPLLIMELRSRGVLSLDGPGKVGRNHPATSRRAATAPAFNTQRFKVLDAVCRAEDGLNAAQVAAQLGLAPNQVATRLLELRELDMVEYVRDEDGNEVERDTGTGYTGLVQTETMLGRIHWLTVRADNANQ